jgi:hypothetical protein
VPAVPGIELNAASLALYRNGSISRVEFQIRPKSADAGQEFDGAIALFAGPLQIGSIGFAYGSRAPKTVIVPLASTAEPPRCIGKFSRPTLGRILMTFRELAALSDQKTSLPGSVRGSILRGIYAFGHLHLDQNA